MVNDELNPRDAQTQDDIVPADGVAQPEAEADAATVTYDTPQTDADAVDRDVPVVQGEASVPTPTADAQAEAALGVAEDQHPADAAEAVPTTQAPPSADDATTGVSRSDVIAQDVLESADEPTSQPAVEQAAPEAPATVGGPVSTVADLDVGMAFHGRVKTITLYGAFVDIGVGKDALLHISQLGQNDVRNVADVVQVGQVIPAFILRVDKEAGRITLSANRPVVRQAERERAVEKPMNDLREGQVVSGTVVRVENYGVFVDVGAERPGMIHVSELTSGFVKSASDVVNVGDTVTAKVIKVNRKKRQLDLSIKQAEQAEYKEAMAQVQQDTSTDEAPASTMAAALRRVGLTREEDLFEEADRGRDRTRRKSARERDRDRRRRDQDDVEDFYGRTLREHTK